MILTDKGILKAIAREEIEITDFNRDRLGSNSYDLTLGNDFLTYNTNASTGSILDARKANPYTRIRVSGKEGIVIHPGQLYLASTVEKTSVYKHAPYIEGKSSVGRLGLRVHATAGVGDIGFCGYWTLEIDCVQAVRIYPGMPIAQIMFLVPSGKCLKPYGDKAGAKYSNQGYKPVPSKMYKNFPNWKEPSDTYGD